MRFAIGNSFTIFASLLFAYFVPLQPTCAVAQKIGTIRAADTSSPRDTLKSFIDACNELNELIRNEKFLDQSKPNHRATTQRVIDCINMSQLPAFARKDRAAEVAVCLKEILDRVDLPAWDQIPDTKEIESAGGLEKLSTWRIPDTRITIARVEQGSQKHEYLFSTGTVDRAVEYFHTMESRPYRTEGPTTSQGLFRWFMSAPGHPAVAAVIERLPKRIQHSSFLGLTTWKWPGLLLSALIAIATMGLAYRVQRALASRLQGKSVFKFCLTLVLPIFAMLTPFVFRHFVQYYLTIRGTPLYVVGFVANLLALLAAVVVVFAFSQRVAEIIIASPRINPKGLNAQLIRIVSRLMSVFLVVALFLAGGQYLGINIATLVASAGIGGIALALGAQDTLKTLFGTLALMGDKPFRVDDRIQFGKYDGIVEDIGLRSTKIRLLTGHLVTIPNDQLAGSDIENIGLRNTIRRKAEIHIPLNTTSEKLEKAVAIIREKLADHEGSTPDLPPRVFFDDFKEDAFVIRFFYWYSPPDYWQFMAFGEKLNFEIFRAFEQHEIHFSLPSRHSYWQQDQQQGSLNVKVLSD